MNTTITVSPVDTEKRKGIGIKPGDTVRVWQKIEEKGKTRLQAFEGLVLARKHGNEPGATFTVRRVSGGIGVEKIFPLYSPMIDKIEIVRRSKVRRAKLYHIRKAAAREIRRQLRHIKDVELSTGSESKVGEEEKAQEAVHEEKGEEFNEIEEGKEGEEDKEQENEGQENEVEKKGEGKEEVKKEIEETKKEE